VIDLEAGDVVDKEILKRVGGLIQAKTNLAFAKEYYNAAEKYANGNNAVLMKITLDFWETHNERLESIEKKLDELLGRSQRQGIKTNKGDVI